jgi:isopentenyldiphosphate isomerase
VFIVNESNKPLSVDATSWTAHVQGLYTRSIQAFICNPRNGKLLLQERAEYKDIFGGRWEIIGEHSAPAEASEDTLLRAFREELHQEISLATATQILPPHLQCNVIRSPTETYYDFEWISTWYVTFIFCFKFSNHLKKLKESICGLEKHDY